MRNRPLVSFLVTYFNQKQYVKKSLDSILNLDNSSFDFEILIGDDGSTDGTIDIIKEYTSKYKNIFLYEKEDNRSDKSVNKASLNRLRLLEKSKGDYFLTLDGDDFYIDKSFVQEALNIYNDNDKLSVIAFGFKEYYEKEDTFGESIIIKGQKNGMLSNREYLRRYYTHAGACVYAKKFGKERIEFLRNIGFFDDNDILINNCVYGDLYYISKAVYGYRQTSSSMFNSMTSIEKSFLNLQGYDVDILIAPQYKEELTRRNLNHIFYSFFVKKNILKYISDEKKNKYIKECKNLNTSICYMIMSYDTLSSKERKKLKRIINVIKYKNIIRYYKYLLKYILRRY